jgi:hypothetical protein
MSTSRPRGSKTRTGIYSARTRRFIKSDHRGAALVEAAIVFIPLCIIVFGIIEYGFIFKDSLTLSSATRAGARAGSAQPKIDQADFMEYVSQATARAATAANFDPGDEMWIYLANDDGTPKDGCPSSSCAVFRYSGSAWPTSPTSGSWDTSNVNACLGGAPGENIDSVGVRLQLSHDALTGFFQDLQLRERTVMKFEPTTTSCS